MLLLYCRFGGERQTDILYKPDAPPFLHSTFMMLENGKENAKTKAVQKKKK